jgi:hypothetical protein
MCYKVSYDVASNIRRSLPLLRVRGARLLVVGHRLARLPLVHPRLSARGARELDRDRGRSLGAPCAAATVVNQNILLYYKERLLAVAPCARSRPDY